MCVLAFAWQAHPYWRLVAAGNRDELHARPAAALARWDEADHVLAGRDLQSGGTWLGVSERSRFAVVTNLRGFGFPDPEAASRGALVADFLKASGPYAEPGLNRLGDFNPFNMLTVSGDEARFLTNRPENAEAGLTSGIYGLSNGALDDPWPKTLQLKALLGDWLNRDAPEHETLFEGLRSETLSDAGLPPIQPSDMALEPANSPVFIRHRLYGTRCSTVVTVDRDGRGTIFERSFAPDGTATGEKRLDFVWND